MMITRAIAPTRRRRARFLSCSSSSLIDFAMSVRSFYLRCRSRITAATVRNDPKTIILSLSAAKGVAGFVVQVVALNDPDKAKQMRDQIAAAGVKTYTEVVPTAKGNVTRVRAGPFASRGDAEKARDKLKGMGLAGNVIPK